MLKISIKNIINMINGMNKITLKFQVLMFFLSLTTLNAINENSETGFRTPLNKTYTFLNVNYVKLCQ